MRLRNSILAFLVFTLGLLMLGSGGLEKTESAEYRLIVASDLHYLAPDLTDHGASFRQLMANSDGKMTEYCVEITDAFLAEVLEQQPEALILTGDLSFNGARQSHLSLAEKLRAVEAGGVPVFVIPGNHDLYRGSSAAYFGDGYEKVPSVSGEEFRQIYADFGFDEALSADEDSLSYAVSINERTWLFMLDANTPHDYCSLSSETLTWLELQLQAAREQGIHCLAACHQNLYQHSMFQGGYQLSCSKKLHELLERYGVPLILSGHMHIQHIKTEGNVTEIASSALTMGACQYGLLSFENNKHSYEARSVDVSSWAKKQDTRDKKLLCFSEYAEKTFCDRTEAQARAMLRDLSCTDEEREALISYACQLNLAYFNGDLTGIAALDPDGLLQQRWEESGLFFGSYLASIRPEFGSDHRHWSD